MGKIIRGTALLGLSVCLSFGVASVSFAQNTNSADLRGTVIDSTGAVVPGVTVTVQDIDKNVTRTYTTNDRGLYDTGSIVPDRYTVTFTKPGFNTYVRGPVTLQVGTSSVDGVLKVGATTQQVVVTTDIPLLKTETGEQSTTLTSESMHQLPQVGANWQNFVTLLPGATGNSAIGTNSTLIGGTPGQVASVNGNLPYNTMLQDGANTTHPISQNAKTAVFETVAEVKISTSAFSAQSGVGGIIFNQITKGGGSQFHGSGYEYFQNNALNAAPYAFGAKAKVPVLRYNNFGFTVGGPIIKKRMFFFFNYDKVLNFGGSTNGFLTIPTAAMKSGDFTGFPTIYDPTTQTITQGPNGPVVHRTSFQDEYHNGNRIPSALIDSVAAAIQSYYPTPNNPGTVVNGLDTNNYFYNTPSSVPLTNYFGRLDLDITPTNRLTASESESDNPGSSAIQGFCPSNCLNYDANFNDAQISDVWTIGPNTQNEFRFGLDQGFTVYNPAALNEGYPTKLGWNFAKADNFPTISINQIYGLGAGVVKAQNIQYGYDPSDVVTLIRGRHVLHFGGEFLMNQGNSTAWGNVNAGTMTYNPVYTSATGVSVTPSGVSGVGYADFLLGQTQSWNAVVTRESGARLKLPQAFIQDDIKVHSNLTLNVGLRWQGMTGWTEVNGNMQSFDPTVLNPVTQTSGAMWYGATHANGRTRLQAPTWNNFLPRIGFSWQPRPNLVVRGGYGLYGYTFSLDTYGAGMGGVFGSSGNSSDETNGLCPVVQLSSDGSTPDTTDPGCGIPGRNSNSINSLYLDTPTSPAARNGQSVTYNMYHAPTPKINQYNLEIQQELGADIVANLAYVGSNAFDLAFPVDINQIPEDKLGPNDSQTSRPYPQYRAITGSTNNAISNYSSLQASIQKRMSSGLEFNFNYVWSHFLDDQDSSAWGGYGGAQIYQNSYVPSANYGPSNFDIRNAFKGHVIYQFPLGRGKRFLNNNYVLDFLLGGWQSAATIIEQSGNPFTVVTNVNNSYNQTPYQYPNVVGNPNSGPHNINEWFNVAAYAQPAPGTYGDSGRNSLRGPKLQQFNFSLGKNFHLTEVAHHNIEMQIRADATNILNHPSFKAPNSAIGSAQAGQIRAVSVGGRAMQLYGRITF